MKKGTIRDLLREAYTAPLSPLEHGTFVCALPADGLENYLLRVGGVNAWTLFPGRLEQTTSLTPVRFVGRNFGQPVLDSRKDFQIVLKKPGKTLWGLFYESFRSVYPDPNDDWHSASLLAYKHVLKTLDALPLQSFRAFANDINYLSAHGIKADFLAPNVMLHGKQLGLIDIDNGKHTGENNLETLMKEWLDFKGYFSARNLTTSSDRELFSLQQRVNAKLVEAARAEGLPPDRDAANALIDAQNPVFHGPVKIAHIARIPLSATPQ